MSTLHYTTLEEIPDEIAATPIEIVRSGARLPCPHDDCSFCYWNVGNRQGKRTPTVQDKFSAQDKPCEHFETAWSPADGIPLEETLREAASGATTIFCVVDEQLALEDDAHKIALYVERQTTLGGF